MPGIGVDLTREVGMRSLFHYDFAYDPAFKACSVPHSGTTQTELGHVLYGHYSCRQTPR